MFNPAALGETDLCAGCLPWFESGELMIDLLRGRVALILSTRRESVVPICWSVLLA